MKQINDPNTILTQEEKKEIKIAEQEFKEGKTFSHEEVKKELRL